ncbi:corticotropin-releasing factor-binding protein-like [Mizuhopecten yessoensis]|uniref:Corticotropin-releasing factor-binding protein n=1 Tax=Mizuhopecten yessoensis TaxID=6573 RepID=A0A210R368_MIZYE|nr:corticotropin-releasing factor-binding protein-like [Mizuhopecten yessoensis]OWF55503.1 Corticotropin-releasing factor-binding protein [Mizuhopecten yessoensis]
MKTSLMFTWILNLAVVLALPMQKRSSLKRNLRNTPTLVQCMDMQSFAGEYKFVADGSGSVCGLYLISLPEKLIELEFLDFNVDCEAGGLAALVDGWEMNGQFFPPPADHHLTLNQRYMTFCGQSKPRRVLVSSQNVLLIQNRIPVQGQGFTVKVKFIDNPQPCNAVSMFTQGVHTIKNYGQRRNCSVSIIYPEMVHLVSVDVGVTAKMNEVDSDLGLSDQCRDSRGNTDYVEVIGGNGFETDSSNRRELACGLTTGAERRGTPVACTNTVIRMVSSGEYFNTVTFVYTQPTEEDLMRDNGTC